MVKPVLRDEEDDTAVDMAISALRAWSYNKRGFVNDDEPTDPEHILAYAHVDIAIGKDVDRSPIRSGRVAPRYALMKGTATIALIAQLSIGWGAFSPEQRDIETPAFGVYPARAEAEAEAVLQTIGRERGRNDE